MNVEDKEPIVSPPHPNFYGPVYGFNNWSLRCLGLSMHPITRTKQKFGCQFEWSECVFPVYQMSDNPGAKRAPVNHLDPTRFSLCCSLAARDKSEIYLATLDRIWP